MKPIVVAAPAKLNLFLAVTGRRADGFHDLVSVAAPVEFGDTLSALRAEEAGGRRQEAGGNLSLTCNDPSVPVDETNLVLKAARAFAAASGWRGGAKFYLEKRIPMGAGLGGGSSDAVAALRALNTLAGEPLARGKLVELAAQLGSDCALFLADPSTGSGQAGPVVMRGRGERVEPLAAGAAARLRGRRVLIFKPGFAIATPWAYAQMSSFAKATEDRAAKSGVYLPAAEAEARLAAWASDDRVTAEKLLFNNMESVAFAKYLALPTLLDELRAKFSLAPRMSGSGSACFALLADPSTGSGQGAPIAAITAAIRAAWGASAFVGETRIL